MSGLRIVSDRNIPFVEQTFAELGDVVTLPAAKIDAAAVRDADILLCRTTIKVGAPLLDGSKVRFVATATIGIDHFDVPYLEQRGIRWAAAPGSNAPSVALWFVSALTALCDRSSTEPGELRIGVVGVGHVGKRVAAIARAFGTTPLLCDPPRARAEGHAGFVSLDELLAKADLVSLHVPLTKEGPDSTRGFVDRERIMALRPGTLVVNACRGEVLDAAALTERMLRGELRAALDVFPDEPSPNATLVGAAEIATPHIAGHSLDGKVAGTEMIYRATCEFLGRAPTFSAAALLPNPEPREVLVQAHHRTDAQVLGDALAPFYDLWTDDRALRAIVSGEPSTRGAAFRAYRDGYPARREPREVVMHLLPRRSHVAAVLQLLGAIV